MGWLSQKIDAALAWISAQILILWTAITDFLFDLAVQIFDLVLQAIAFVIAAIPVPSFLAGGGMQTMLNGLDPAVLYFLSRSGLTAAFGVLAAGLTFRLLRKLVTLGQW